MTGDLVKIDPKAYGLEETKAKEISAMFQPMLQKMEELEDEYNNVVLMAPSKTVCATAKALRLQYVKVRTGTAKVHKDLKAFYLQGGKFVDGWKNAQLMAGQGIEGKLKAIEDHFEIEKRERIAALQEIRARELEQFQPELVTPNLGEMQEDVWKNFLAGAKANHDAQVEAERKAEEERVAKEKADAEERIRLEEAEKKLKAKNEKLEKEAAEHDAVAKKEREEKETLEAELEEKKQAEKDREEEEKREAQEKIQREIKAKALEEENAKLKAAQDERDRLAKIEADKQAAANKDDASKVTHLIKGLNVVKSIVEFKSKKNKKMFEDVKILIDKTISFIKSKE